MLFKVCGFMIYDLIGKIFMMMGVDNVGGMIYEMLFGWIGDVVVLVGEVSFVGRKVFFCEVILCKGDCEFIWWGEMKVGGDWMIFGEDCCWC